MFLVPFVTAIGLPLIALRDERRCRPVALAALSVMAVLSLMSLGSVLNQGEVRYAFSGWAPPVGIEWVADEIASIMVVAASLLALVSMLYSSPFPTQTLQGRSVPYYSILLLLVSGLSGVIYGGDLFNIFVFLEIVAISAYSLVAVPGGRALVSAFRYLIMGALGASFYLLGVAYFYSATGTLNIADLAQRTPGLLESKAVIGGLLFMFIGLGIKMALMPLHAWLPDAYSDAPRHGFSDPCGPVDESCFAGLGANPVLGHRLGRLGATRRRLLAGMGLGSSRVSKRGRPCPESDGAQENIRLWRYCSCRPDAHWRGGRAVIPG